jgi:hypothetical protein
MSEHLVDLEEGLQEISTDFDAGKEFIECLEQLVHSS